MYGFLYLQCDKEINAKMRSRDIRRIRKKRRYGYAKRSPARKGIFSLAVWLLAFISLVLLILASYVKGGEAGAYIGALGLITEFLAIFGIWLGVDSFHEPDRSYGVSQVATGLNVITAAAFIIIFIIGAV